MAELLLFTHTFKFLVVLCLALALGGLGLWLALPVSALGQVESGLCLCVAGRKEFSTADP